MGKNLLFGLIATIAIGGVTRGDDQADAMAILNDAITAHGGQAVLGKFISQSFKGKGTTYEEDKKTAMSTEQSYQTDEKMRLTIFNADGKADEIVVVVGKTGWSKSADKATEKLTDDELASQRECMYLNWATLLVPLKAKEYRLSVIDESLVAGRSAVGILVTREKHDPLKLYFDKENHLLAKYERTVKPAEGGVSIQEEGVYSDYKNVQEMKQPYKFEMFWDGVKISDIEITEQKFSDKPLDDKLFEKP